MVAGEHIGKGKRDHLVAKFARFQAGAWTRHGRGRPELALGKADYRLPDVAVGGLEPVSELGNVLAGKEHARMILRRCAKSKLA